MKSEEGLKKLREPFPENQINYLPRPTKRREEMAQIPKALCSVCGGYHATKHIIHLAYVGHAALTDRLLDVDPTWTWEPLSLDEQGLPALDKDGGLWIKLTVCGVTRLGYGDAQGKTGGDAMKERIGDALRNAAMRFGAALELWHKGELHERIDERDVTSSPDNSPDDVYGRLIQGIDWFDENNKKPNELMAWYEGKSAAELKQQLDAELLSKANKYLSQMVDVLTSKNEAKGEFVAGKNDYF